MSDDCLLWVGGKYETVADFIKEARVRGCCRRMASCPPWAKPGETRMFLAHRDGHKRADIGFVFGYFTLGGVGIPPSGEPEPPDDEGGGENGGKSPAGRPPSNGGEAPENGEYEISTEQIKAEPERICGVRFGGAAVYVVDALARDIDSIFGDVLKKAEATHKEAPDDTLPAGGGFPEAVQAAGGDRDPVTSIPAELADFAHRHGELVVFDRPYPSFRKRPRAFFRHLVRIDGDELLHRIVAVYERGGKDRSIRIPYYHATPDKKKTKEQLIAELAEESETSKSCAADFWGALAERITQELGDGRPMTLTGVGTFRVKRARGPIRSSLSPAPC